MLTNLHVRNLALIDEADINFKDGLNILTGETGAGKSIILGSINIALGGKTSADLIRKDAEYALTELSFYIENDSVRKQLTDLGIEELEDGELVISRKITPSRSQIKVNGQTFTQGQVKAAASLLIDIHGQHDNQLLLKESHHIEILDEYAKAELQDTKQKLKEVYAEYSSIQKQLSELNIDEEQKNREISFLEFEIQEILSAKLSCGEDVQLETAFRKMSHVQKIMEEMSVVDQKIVSGSESVCDMFGTALRALNSAAAYDEDLQELSGTMADVESLLSDISRMITDYIDNCSFNEEEYINIQQRLDLINSLKLKYGKTIEEIKAYSEKKQQRLEQLQSHDKLIEELKSKSSQKEKELSALCGKLSDMRKDAADRLCSSIRAALLDLNFNDVRFDAHFESTDTFSSNGTDLMYFVIAANLGEVLRPLSKVASGGELSRIMLAIRTVTANQDDIETLIFDEIDAGISGRTAQMVGEKLSILAHSRQIICITHLPQIASMADNHFMIEKSVENNVTKTSIYELSDEQSIEELARLLGGSSITEAVKANAQEMRQLALNYKNKS